MTALDQLVFGYREGHQLLGGSRQLDPRDLRLLLGATDMTIDGSNGRFLTGLPLATQSSYALCATWAAPEQARPGAVWAHAVIIPGELLGELDDPLAITASLTRPARTALGAYNSKLDLPNRVVRPEPPRGDILERVIVAAYGSGSQSVLVEGDLELAEEAIGALWRAQWPALRLAFTFRTRPTARADKAGADLVIARQVRGTTRLSSTHTRSVWVKLIAEAILIPEESTFRNFLNEFGPLEPANVRTVRVLADVFRHLGEGSVDTVRETLERDYPTAEAGAALKLALFGPGSARPWSGSEQERVQSLLASKVDAWDVEALNLSARVEGLMAAQGVGVVSQMLSGASTRMSDAVLQALVRRNDANDIRDFVAAHDALVVRLVAARPELLSNADAWTGLPDGAAFTLLRAGTLSPGGIVAAIHAGYGADVLSIAELSVVAGAILRGGTYADACTVLGNASPEQLRRGPADDRLAFLSVAMWGPTQIEADLPERLERNRDQTDEFWLRAAVEAIASTSLPRSEVLGVTFGPLHDAITADRLPRECWRRLDEVLPPAPDPALRLRRYLLGVAQEEQWTTDQFERSLRGAGPHAGRLLHDFDDDEDWWVAATRAVIRAAVEFLGGRR